MPIVHVDDKSFKEEVLNSSIPVLVDFFASWCMPCKRVAPILDEISKEYEGKVKVVKIDVDEAGSTASKFGIMSVPTLMVFNSGKVSSQSAGAMSKHEIKSKLAEVLGV